ncbi:hypothetical protein AB9P05_10120 [Roseivirga sp. BDSF3-8]|uniref:hypothetical protein n=1 Tax=Roseivirga sp. BDSF3-8 TaxID=3241598 RepID=UPI00353193F9
MKYLRIIVFLLISILAIVQSCNKEEVEQSGGGSLPDEIQEIFDPEECTCLETFDNLPFSKWSAGDTITGLSCLEAISVKHFQFTDGSWTSGGLAQTWNAAPVNMSGRAMFTGNTTLHFNLPCTVDGLCIKVADYGGNINLRINGDFVNVPDFNNVDGQVIGNTQVTITYDSSGDPAVLCLTGAIYEFALGGQELFIDDLCLGPCMEDECTCRESFDRQDYGPYKVGDGFALEECEGAVAFDKFEFSNGTVYAKGQATMQTPAAPHMSGQVMQLNNINAYFNLPCTVDGLCIDVADFGGNENLEVNGDFINFSQFSSIDGQQLGGTTINIVYDSNGNPIRLCIDGPVKEFMIGGQELQVDSLCPGPCL